MSHHQKTKQYIIEPAHTFFESTLHNPNLIHQAESPILDLYEFQGKTIGRLKQPSFKISNPIEIDYLIISCKGFIDMTSIATHIHFKHLILDVNTSEKVFTSMAKFCTQHGKILHSVAKDGAFVLKL